MQCNLLICAGTLLLASEVFSCGGRNGGGRNQPSGQSSNPNVIIMDNRPSDDNNRRGQRQIIEGDNSKSLEYGDDMGQMFLLRRKRENSNEQKEKIDKNESKIGLRFGVSAGSQSSISPPKIGAKVGLSVDGVETGHIKNTIVGDSKHHEKDKQSGPTTDSRHAGGSIIAQQDGENKNGCHGKGGNGASVGIKEGFQKGWLDIDAKKKVDVNDSKEYSGTGEANVGLHIGAWKSDEKQVFTEGKGGVDGVRAKKEPHESFQRYK